MSFFKHRGWAYASSTLMKPIADHFVADIGHYAAARDLDLVRFRKGERKDDIAQRYLAEAAESAACPAERVAEQVLSVIQNAGCDS